MSVPAVVELLPATLVPVDSGHPECVRHPGAKSFQDGLVGCQNPVAPGHHFVADPDFAVDRHPAVDHFDLENRRRLDCRRHHHRQTLAPEAADLPKAAWRMPGCSAYHRHKGSALMHV